MCLAERSSYWEVLSQTQTVASVFSSVWSKFTDRLTFWLCPSIALTVPANARGSLVYKELRGVKDHRQAFSHLHSIFSPCGFCLALLCGYEHSVETFLHLMLFILDSASATTSLASSFKSCFQNWSPKKACQLQPNPPQRELALDFGWGHQGGRRHSIKAFHAFLQDVWQPHWKTMGTLYPCCIVSWHAKTNCSTRVLRWFPVKIWSLIGIWKQG